MTRRLQVEHEWIIDGVPGDIDLFIYGFYTYIELKELCDGASGGDYILNAVVKEVPKIYTSEKEFSEWVSVHRKHWDTDESKLIHLYTFIQKNGHCVIDEKKYEQMNIEFNEFWNDFNEEKYIDAICEVKKMFRGQHNNHIISLCQSAGLNVSEERGDYMSPRDIIDAIETVLATSNSKLPNMKMIDTSLVKMFCDWLIAKDDELFKKWIPKYHHPSIHVQYV